MSQTGRNRGKADNTLEFAAYGQKRVPKHAVICFACGCARLSAATVWQASRHLYFRPAAIKACA